MLGRSIAAGLAGSLLLAGVAFAAETSTATSDRANSTAASSTNASYHGDWRTSKVVGLSVYNSNNESIGSINDLLMDKGGNIKAAVLSVGGFLGVGARLVALPFDQVKFVDEPVATTGASNAPANRPASTTTTGSASTTTGSASTTTGSASTSSSSMTGSKPNPWYPDHAVISATKDQLQGMPEFKFTNE
jgi:sporulation protein YlmC with PRC-barrel domain